MSWRHANLIIDCVLLSSCGTASVRSATLQSEDHSRFTYTRLYCTPDNESHFETVTVDLAKVDAAPPASPMFVKPNSASRMALAGVDPRWGAQDLQARVSPGDVGSVVDYLQGVMSIATTDGDTRHFGPGDVLPVEDIASCKGHIGVVGDKTSFTMIPR